MIADLKISDNRRFLITEDGKPFFWLGDTAWELFHQLNRDEAEHYLRKRADQGFNVIQAVALAEFDGLNSANAYGRVPLKRKDNGVFDPIVPDLDGDYSYWDHVDTIVDLAGELGMYIAFLPTWGDKFHQTFGKGPEIFTTENAWHYGRWLGNRYKNKPNLIWVLGGDRPLSTRKHFEIVKAMADGLAEGDGGRHLRTFHPPGETSSADFVHEETWLDFNMIQSGHDKRLLDNDERVARDYAREPVKPTFDAEPCYEDHPIGFKAENGYFDAADVRHAAYNNVFAGGFGHTYGHHSVWSMTTEPTDYFIMTWKDALDRPGAWQMRHLKALIEAKPFLEHRPAPELIAYNYIGANRMNALRGEDHAFIYTPNGLPVHVASGELEGWRANVRWYDPRNGTYGNTREVKFDSDEAAKFTPPSSGRGEDWVLVIERE